jgi:hypothetical protein
MAQTKLATVNQYGNSRVNVGIQERFGSIGSSTMLGFGTVLPVSAMIAIVERQKECVQCSRKEGRRMLCYHLSGRFPFLVMRNGKS